MPPFQQEDTATAVLFENDAKTIDGGLAHDTTQLKQVSEKYKIQLIWNNIIVFSVAHLLGIYGIYLCFTSANWKTSAFAFILHYLSVLGITAGVHRLWSHKSYSARTPLKLFLAFTSTIAYQNSAYHWACEHRVHHKFSETDADPTNALRGLFFSHVGWLLCKKHPDVYKKRNQIDMSDLKNDPIVWFQHKNYAILTIFIAIIGPLVIPVFYWNETWFNSLCIAVMLRWACGLNVAWIVNSFAHQYGNRPYDKEIHSVDNLAIVFFTMGEGYHNYHHVFPWDYKTSEFGYKLSSTTLFIDFMALIGQAYNLKTVSMEIIEKRVKRTGDGTHNLWGWGDQEQDQCEQEDATITHKQLE